MLVADEEVHVGEKAPVSVTDAEVALIPHVDDDTHIDTDATTHASIEAFVYSSRAFQGGPIDRSMLMEYADHLACKLWQGEVYIFYV